MALHLRLADEPSAYEAAQLTTSQAERVEALLHTAIEELEQKLSVKSCLTPMRSSKSVDPKTAG